MDLSRSDEDVTSAGSRDLEAQCVCAFLMDLSSVLVFVDSRALEQCVNADCSHSCSAYAGTAGRCHPNCSLKFIIYKQIVSFTYSMFQNRHPINDYIQ